MLPQSAAGTERGGHGAAGGKTGKHAGSSTQRRGAPRSEACETLPFDVFHWAAVSFVIAMTGGVLGYAAGTPALATVANVFCYMFSVIAGALALAGYLAPRGEAAGEPDLRDTAASPRAD